MDHNIHNHICNNTTRRMERDRQGRIDSERALLNRLYQEEDQGLDCEGNRKPICKGCTLKCKNEHGGEVYFANVGKMAYRNQSYRESIWTGDCLQMTLMSIPCGEDVGEEIHNDTDQYIRVEYGSAIAMTGDNANCLNNKYRMRAGDAIFIPAGTWHNIVNAGRCALKLSSVYAPPHHPRCTVEKYKK